MTAEIKVLEAEPLGEDIVEKLEEALAEARKGAFSSIAIAAVCRDGAAQTTYSYAPSRILQIGAVSRLLWRLNNALEKA